MANYANGLSVQATPTRDRDRLPFPQSSHPSPAPSLRQTSSSSASTSLTNLNSASTTTSASISPQPISVDSLLKQFASSADPKAAALDQAVSDRNVLSAQNTQLWKLIEKQRTGYNQILKELERIRGERDAYKSRLASLNGNAVTDIRQKTTSERGSRPSLDTASSHASASSTSPVHTRQPMARHHSNDNTTPKSLNYPPNIHSSRSFEPLSERATNNYTTARSASPLPAPPASAPSSTSFRPTKPSPSPLAVPTAVADSSASDVNGVYASSTRQPIQPRKSSVADSISSVVTSGSSLSSISSPATSIPPVFNQQIFGNGSSTQAAEGHPGRQKQTNASISSISSNTPPPNPSYTPPPPISAANNPPSSAQTLTPTDNRPHALSRDSRISLPDEERVSPRGPN